MTDIEAIVYTAVKDKLPKGWEISAEYEHNAKGAIRHVTFEEKTNSTYTPSMTVGENHSTVMYEVNIYSNSKKGKRAECKAVRDIIDAELIALGFVRETSQSLPNLADRTIHRINCRYSAVVGTDKTIYRR